jgi:hypothetical protein
MHLKEAYGHSCAQQARGLVEASLNDLALPLPLSLVASDGVVNQRWEHLHARCYALGTIAMGRSSRLSHLSDGMAGMRLPSKRSLERQDLQVVSVSCAFDAYLRGEGGVSSQAIMMRNY